MARLPKLAVTSDQVASFRPEGQESYVLRKPDLTFADEFT